MLPHEPAICFNTNSITLLVDVDLRIITKIVLFENNPKSRTKCKCFPLKLFSRKLKLPREKLFVIPTKPHKTSPSPSQTDVHAHLHHIYINTLHQLLQLSPALAPRFRNEILILSAPTNQDSQDTNTGNAPLTSQLQFPTTRRGDTIFPICNLWSKVQRTGR